MIFKDPACIRDLPKPAFTVLASLATPVSVLSHLQPHSSFVKLHFASVKIGVSEKCHSVKVKALLSRVSNLNGVREGLGRQGSQVPCLGTKQSGSSVNADVRRCPHSPEIVSANAAQTLPNTRRSSGLR